VNFERPYKDVLASFERDYLERAIAYFGSVGEAAKRLGVDRTTIFRKMKKAAGE
jgi:transcriptional regulator of acetoin/glycerol metabolism